MTVPVLEMQGVVAGYGPVTVLDGLALALRPGEVLLVLGANGSGKSTVLKTLMGLTRVSQGTVRLGAEDITRLPAHRRAAAGFGYVPQTRNVFADLTVAENLSMGGWLVRQERRAATEAALALFPRLADRLRARAGDLSGGERRMLSIALALIPSPTVLLLDEPSSDLAPIMVDAVFAAVQRIRQERAIPLLLVEQNIAKGLAIADRVVVMARGRAVADMPAAEVEPARLHDLFIAGSVREPGA